MSVLNDKRLTLNIPEALHTEIKSRSACKRISLKKWVMQAIALKILKENTSKGE